MGIFDGLFNKSEVKIEDEAAKLNWLPLKSIDELNSITDSDDQVSVIFKHSTRCIISKNVLRQFEIKNTNLNHIINFYYLDLLSYRSISDAIIKKFQVIHQSPQLIVIKDGKTLAHDSHYEIINLDLKKFTPI